MSAPRLRERRPLRQIAPPHEMKPGRCRQARDLRLDRRQDSLRLDRKQDSLRLDRRLTPPDPPNPSRPPILLQGRRIALQLGLRPGNRRPGLRRMRPRAGKPSRQPIRRLGLNRNRPPVRKPSRLPDPNPDRKRGRRPISKQSQRLALNRARRSKRKSARSQNERGTILSPEEIQGNARALRA